MPFSESESQRVSLLDISTSETQGGYQNCGGIGMHAEQIDEHLKLVVDKGASISV